jgi:tRNA threonylcarbamoyladenosine biosynthesis protein TsaB
MKILAIETSTETGSVAWLENGAAVAEITFRRKNAHAEVLAPAIEHVAALAGRTVPDAEAVALSAGPGSYTGLRVGASLAKGLCEGLGIPLYPVDTLQALAWGASTAAHLLGHVRLAPVLDARRMEVYRAVYEPDGALVLPSAPEVVTEDFLADVSKEAPLLLLGNGMPKLIEMLLPTGRFLFLPGQEPHARYVGELAHLDIETGAAPADIIRFEPEYLKPYMGTPPQKE